MNLEQSVSLESLRTVPTAKPEKKRLTALQMAERVFKISAAAGHPYRNITPKEWAKKWLASPAFVLTEVETDKIALIRTPRNINKVMNDLHAAASRQEPVVVDLNKNNLSAKNGFVPRVVAVDGAHRCYGEYLRGRDLMRAWVGTEALDRVRPEPLFAASEITTPPVQERGTKLSSAMALYATGMPTVQRSGAPDGPSYIKNRGVQAEKVSHTPDSVVSNARDKITWKVDQKSGKIAPPGMKAGVEGHADDCKCAECREMKATGAGGAGASMGNGSGPNPNLVAGKKVKAGGPVKASVPAARSSGRLNESDPSDETVPPDPSDSGTFVSPSDQLQYEDEPQHFPPGVKGWNDEIRGKNNPMSEAPGSGVGPRLTPNRGASNSELQRTMKAKGKKEKDCDICGKSIKAAAKHVKKLVADFKAAVAKGYKPRMNAKTPPGCEDAVMGLKKSKVDNPWAVANWMKDQGRC